MPVCRSQQVSTKRGRIALSRRRDAPAAYDCGSHAKFKVRALFLAIGIQITPLKPSLTVRRGIIGSGRPSSIDAICSSSAT